MTMEEATVDIEPMTEDTVATGGVSNYLPDGSAMVVYSKALV